MAEKQTMSAASVAEVLKGTNAPEVNTNALPANTDKALPIYDKEGNLIGYIPLYNTPW